MKKEDASKVTYFCAVCDATFSKDYTGWYPTAECPTCHGSARMTNLVNLGTSGISHVGRYKEPVAFVNTPKGEMGVDKKGKIIDPSETRYNLRGDPHGWRASGKRVREYDKHGRLNV